MIIKIQIRINSDSQQFFFVKDSAIYNYADDNTVSNCDNDIDVVTKILENDRMELINWFSLNLMKANPDKFQAIAIEKKTKSQNVSLNLSGNKIVCEANVKLLGVTIDSDLNFDNHISEMCKIRLRENQFISSILSFSKVLVTTSISLSQLDTVLSSA
jgi:hypothetical protein